MTLSHIKKPQTNDKTNIPINVIVLYCCLLLHMSWFQTPAKMSPVPQKTHMLLMQIPITNTTHIVNYFGAYQNEMNTFVFLLEDNNHYSSITFYKT